MTTRFLLPLAMVVLSSFSVAQVIVTPGNTGTALGVTINNYTNSNGNGSIANDGSGNADVSLASGFKGEVSGMDANDTMITGANVDAKITASGGTIQIGGSETCVTVTNPDDSQATVTVLTPDGDSVEITPGNTVKVCSE